MRIEEQGGSHINASEGFDHMVSLAQPNGRIGSHKALVFEIDLPGHQRGRPLHWLLGALTVCREALMLLEHAIHGLAGRDRQLEKLEHGIALEGVLNGLLSGQAP
jgi:aromatic ring-cleaving dioxygenase